MPLTVAILGTEIPLHIVLVIGACTFAILRILEALLTIRWVKIEHGQALLVTKTGSEDVRVSFTGGYVPPFHSSHILDISLHTIEIHLEGRNAVLSRDQVRTNVSATFQIKVHRSEEDILEVSRNLGCEAANNPATVAKLFSPKFTEALITAASMMDFEKLQPQRIEFREAVKDVVGIDLNGFHLEDVAITTIEKAGSR